MTEQVTGGGDTSPGILCEHGLTVDGPREGECQLCDWCPRCEMVRRFDRETCCSCGYEWGTPTGRPTPVEPLPDPTLASQGWPWYEARLSVHVRESKPTDTFGEGGEELAHARAWTQAPSFREAVERLDGDLAKNWTQITANAELVDTPPSPDVLPPPVKWWDRPLEVRTVVLVYALFIVTLSTLLALAALR